jgi:hypothetical protein
MEQPCEAEVHSKLFEFVEGKRTGLPNDIMPRATGALLAAEDLLRAAGHLPGSGRPKGWRKNGDCFYHRFKDSGITLEISKSGDYWFVTRIERYLIESFAFLALAFEQVPICTNTFEEAMRLADHCHPDPGQTLGGCWARAGV